MFVPLPAWMKNAADAIRLLAERPWTLFFVLLAMNAAGRPCSITAHDARLYSLQAINQAEHGAYADDVFLRYGSQDQFSLYSHLVGPLVATIGLRPAFFVLYLAFNTLLIYAMFRLVRALIADAVISTLALAFLCTAPLPYGGHDIFTVHEQFFTPRIVGTAFTLLAVERLIRHRFITSMALLIAGALVHPLMAFGGVMIWIGYVACTYLPFRVFVALFAAGVVGATMVLAIPALGTRLFGEMDDEWHRLIRIAVAYNYPDAWHAKDWINLAASFAIPIAACLTVFRDDADRRRFLGIAALAGVVGFLATLAASFLPYALLFQAQPYRVLWILKVLQAPLGFLLIARWSASPAVAARLAAVTLIAYFCVQHYLVSEFAMFAIVLTIALILSYFGDEPGVSWRAAAYGLVLGAMGWMAYRCSRFVDQRETILAHWDVCEWVLFELVSPVLWPLALCFGLLVCARSARSLAALGWASAAVSVLAPLGIFAIEAMPRLRAEYTRYGADIEFLRDFVHERGHARPPAIYSAAGRPDLLWVDVGATSYFDILQIAGVIFNRQTAQEMDRRAAVVARFEMARQRHESAFLDDAHKAAREELFRVSFDCPPATIDDLRRLCQEPGLDYVMIRQEFPGLYSASNGRFYIYECYRFRPGR